MTPLLFTVTLLVVALFLCGCLGCWGSLRALKRDPDSERAETLFSVSITVLVLCDVALFFIMLRMLFAS